MVIDGLANYFFDSLVLLAVITLIVSYLLLRQARSSKEAKRGIFWAAVIGVVLSLGWLLLSSTVGVTTQARSCKWCHEMSPEYNTWRASAHNRVQCLACHTPPSSGPAMLFHEARALPEVWLHFTGNYPKIINKDSSLSQKEMTSASCERCHDMNKKRTVVTGDMKMNHAAHLRLKVTCQTCHNRVTHKEARGYPYLNGMEMMAGCMRCHLAGKEKTVTGEKAPSGCNTCHVPTNWARRVFGTPAITAADMKNCIACHRIKDPALIKDYSGSKMVKAGIGCSDCHNSHFQKFVAEPSAKDCGVCHPEAANKVIKGTMGFKGYKPPFKKPAEVRCGLCHKAHAFKATKPKPGEKRRGRNE